MCFICVIFTENVLFLTGTSKTLYSTNMALSSSPGISAVQLVRTVGHSTTNHLIPALCTSSPQTLPMNNSCLTNAVHLNNVSVVSPVNVHINARTSAPSPTALKLATVAASMDRVPKVTPSSAISSIARCVYSILGQNFLNSGIIIII